MRVLFALHQHRIGNAIPLTVKRLVQLATLDGAVDLGIADKTGSLTPGKRADIILVRTTDINMTPVGDPYEALVSLAQPGNVDTVIVDGRILRRGGKFTEARSRQGRERRAGGGGGAAQPGEVAGVSASGPILTFRIPFPRASFRNVRIEGPLASISC